jgi:ABC-type Fe3+-hydroxamate transport system substrate-binding protein
MSLTPPEAPSVAPPARQVPAVIFAAAMIVIAAVAIGGVAAYIDLHPAAPAAAGTTVDVVDDLGRIVTVPVDPHSIVVLAPSIMDIVYRLGLRTAVVGVGCDAELTGGIYNEYSPNQTRLWGLSNNTCVTDYPELDAEAVALLGPQLVLASTITSALAVDALTETYGIPVVVFGPSTLEGIVGDVRILAQVFPAATPAATHLEAALEEVLSNASAWDTNFSNNNISIPTVLLSYYFDAGGYYTYGPGSFGDSLIALAGGDNIAASVPLVYGELNATVALVDQPSYVLYGTSSDVYLVAGETGPVWTSSAPYWSQLNGTKISVDVVLLSEPDPSMIFFLPLLMHWLHPTLVPAP